MINGFFLVHRVMSELEDSQLKNKLTHSAFYLSILLSNITTVRNVYLTSMNCFLQNYVHK